MSAFSNNDDDDDDDDDSDSDYDLKCIVSCVCMSVVWNTGTRTESILPLEDEDRITETADGWKRVNTLLHYHVKDRSEIHLIYDRERTNSVADGEPHVVRNIHGRTLT